jgi:hypothetical protein
VIVFLLQERQFVQRGFGIVIVADKMGTNASLPVSITAVVVESLWESSKFTIKHIDNFTLDVSRSAVLL